jgi:DNA invertase Pin-like site-specific DNA recombinase
MVLGERDQCQERTALRRASSRTYGTKFGCPGKVNDAEHIATAKRMKADDHTGKDIAKYLGVSRATLYRYLADEAALLRSAGVGSAPVSPYAGPRFHNPYTPS